MSEEYTQAELDAAFTSVQNAEHWKGPVNAVVSETANIHLIEQAVIHFTGTVATIKKIKAGYSVKAAGYWGGPCA